MDDTDFIGKRFDRLTVVGVYDKKNNMKRWACKCLNCGNFFNITQHNLTSGSCISCGCVNRESSKKNINKYLGQVEQTNLSAIASDKLGKANTSGVKGVSYNRKMQKYVAYIGFQGKNKILGYFKTLEEAATARKQAEEELYKPILEKYDYKSNKKLT